MINIALDAMGGDHAPGEVVAGAIDALKAFDNLSLYLLGPEDIIKKSLKSFGQKPSERLKIIHAPDIVDMSESASLSYRKKKESSIRVGIEMVHDKKAEAFVSAGNTGAIMAASTFTYGRLDHVERPALATLMPGKFGPSVMLDMGSNVDCKPIHLAQFAIMGSYFAQLVLEKPSPKVGLLNIGEEEDKGDSLTIATYDLLKQLDLNFIGNIEGKDILYSKSDVIVCDGFVGNCVLKFGEGAAELFADFFKSAAKKSIRALLGLLMVKPTFMTFKKQFDYAEYGGAPLLGLNGISVIGHGKSNRKAILNAIGLALHAAETKVVEHIQESINQCHNILQLKRVDSE